MKRILIAVAVVSTLLSACSAPPPAATRIEAVVENPAQAPKAEIKVEAPQAPVVVEPTLAKPVLDKPALAPVAAPATDSPKIVAPAPVVAAPAAVEAAAPAEPVASGAAKVLAKPVFIDFFAPW